MSTPIRTLVDKALGGTLHDRLQDHVDAGLSHESIARLLADEGIEVTRETVRQWCLQLGIKRTPAA